MAQGNAPFKTIQEKLLESTSTTSSNQSVSRSSGTIVVVGPPGPRGLTGATGLPGSVAEEFETISKNIKNYPYTLVYNSGDLSSIIYDLGGALSITKTFNYTLGILTSIVLSGDTPAGINLTKTFDYTGDDLTTITYS